MKKALILLISVGILASLLAFPFQSNTEGGPSVQAANEGGPSVQVDDEGCPSDQDDDGCPSVQDDEGCPSDQDNEGCRPDQDDEGCPSVQCPEQECPPCERSCEGLTPGYWKNHLSKWECYRPDTTLEDVFNVPNSLGLDGYTLLQALNFNGGPGLDGMARNMFRHAVAALLNSCSSEVDYPYETENGENGVIDYVNAVNWNSRSHMEELKDTFEASNKLGVNP